MPEITVVTSVYNSEKYIGETIESIINQTFTDWEYILINDCSTDRSAEVIESYAAKDSRIRLYNNEKNAGQVANLNKAAELATGKYIAHTDHDDISLPERFEKQYAYMEAHPEVVILGTGRKILEEGKIRPDHTQSHVNNPAEARFIAAFENPVGHSTMMRRRQELLDKGIQYKDYRYAEDFAYVCDSLSIGDIDVLKDDLILYRVFPEQVTKTVGNDLIDKELKEIKLNYIKHYEDKQVKALLDAREGTLTKEYDASELQVAFEKYADVCGVDMKAECVKDAFLDLANMLPKCRKTLSMYINSPYKKSGWMRSRPGRSLLVRCLFGLN